MLAATSSGQGSTALLLMHFFGGAAREWNEVVALLSPNIRTVAIDMPGFGDSADVPGYTVTAMADSVSALIASLVADGSLTRFVLAGHSMSGKVASVLASRVQQNTPGSEHLRGLAGLVLVAPSPTAPEPIPDDKRATMLDALSEIHPDDRERARRYVTKNESRDIPEPILTRATDDVLRMNRAAWAAWIEHGTREDWTDRVGTLHLPTLLVVGENDTSLGLEVQQRLTLPNLTRATVQVVPGSGHLIPMEKPAELARHLADFLHALEVTVPQPYLDLIHSDRVSPRTRELLLKRLEPRGWTPQALTPAQLQTLRAVVARVIPQETPAIDLAAFIDEQLASGVGNGWRYAALPPDREAYAQSLDRLDEMASALHESSFASLTPEQQDGLLTQIAAAGPIQRPHLARWFEDLRADAVAAWMAHPRTLARIGYSGIGIGGADTPHAGFVSIGPGVVEPWEPAPSQPQPEKRS
jgi:pimeloyl-ACP methyl ester carboxylesterase